MPPLIFVDQINYLTSVLRLLVLRELQNKKLPAVRSLSPLKNTIWNCKLIFKDVLVSSLEW